MRTCWLSFALQAALACTAASSCLGATLRPFTELRGPQVRLCDLFEGVGPAGDRVLGAAPSVGESLTVGAAQLAAIARQFGVDWRPVSAGDSAILDRPGAPLSREAVLAALRRSLEGAGAPDGDIELPGFAAPLVADELEARPTVEQFAFDSGSGRFTASVIVAAGNPQPLRLRLSGKLLATEDVLVAAHRLAPGAVIGPADLREARIRSDVLHGDAVLVAAQATGLTVRRTVQAGEPVMLASLVKPEAVTRGARVTITLESVSLSVSATAIALQAGAQGDRIEVLNPISRAVLLATVTGPGSVSLEPGSVPLRIGTGTGRVDPDALRAASNPGLVP